MKGKVKLLRGIIFLLIYFGSNGFCSGVELVSLPLDFFAGKPTFSSDSNRIYIPSGKAIYCVSKKAESNEWTSTNLKFEKLINVDTNDDIKCSPDGKKIGWFTKNDHDSYDFEFIESASLLNKSEQKTQKKQYSNVYRGSGIIDWSWGPRSENIVVAFRPNGEWTGKYSRVAITIAVLNIRTGERTNIKNISKQTRRGLTYDGTTKRMTLGILWNEDNRIYYLVSEEQWWEPPMQRGGYYYEVTFNYIASDAGDHQIFRKWAYTYREGNEYWPKWLDIHKIRFDGHRFNGFSTKDAENKLAVSEILLKKDEDSHFNSRILLTLGNDGYNKVRYEINKEFSYAAISFKKEVKEKEEWGRQKKTDYYWLKIYKLAKKDIKSP